MLWRTKKHAEASGQKPLQLAFAGSAHYDAAKLFEDALYGDKCRTVAFENGDGALKARVFRRAQYTDSEFRWQVFEFSEQDISANGAPRVTSTPVASKLTFLDAIKNLAQFEQGRLALGETVHNSATHEKLGLEHYQAFAEREGIIFDEDGMPHPTLNGEIVTAGKFSPEALQRARAHKRPAGTYYRLNNDFLASMIGNATVNADIFGRIAVKIRNRSHLVEFICAVEAIHTVAHCCFEKKIWKDDRDILQTDGSDLRDTITYPHSCGSKIYDSDARSVLTGILTKYETPGTCIKRLVQSADQSLEQIMADKEEKKKLSLVCHHLHIVFLAMASKHLFMRARESDKNAIQTFDESKKILENAIALYRQKGASESDINQIRGYILDKTPLRVPEATKEAIQRLHKISENLKLDTDRDIGAALSQPT